jgi:hypothetical protein
MQSGPVLSRTSPTHAGTGRPRLHCLREILDAVLYIVRSG